MVAGHGRKAQEGPCGGYAGLFEKVEQFLLGVTQNNALAHQGQGFPGKVDQSRRRLNLFGLHFWCGPVAADEAYGLIVVVEARKLGVFGDVDEYRSGTSAAGNVKGTGNGIGNVFGLFYLKIPLGDGLGNAYHVGLLEGVGAQQSRTHLSADDDQRGRVHHGIGNAGNGIGCTGTGGDYGHTYPTSDACVTLGSMHSALFVSGQHVVQFFLEGVQRIVNGHDRSTGIAEEYFGPFIQKRSHYRLGAGHPDGSGGLFLAFCLGLCFATGRQRGFIYHDVDAAGGDVDFYRVAVFNQGNVAACCCLGRDVTDRKTGGAARKAAVGDQGTEGTQLARLQVGGRVKHFLHTRSSFGSFVADEHHFSGLYFSGKDAFAGVVLRFVHAGRPLELKDGGIYACCFNDAPLPGNVAEEYGQSPVLKIGVLHAADAAFFAVEIQAAVGGFLTGQFQVDETTGGTLIKVFGAGQAVLTHYVVMADGVGQTGIIDAAYAAVDELSPLQFCQYAQDASGPVDVLHVVVAVGGHFAQNRRLAGKLVDVVHAKIDLRFVGNGQEVQHGIGASAHGNIEGHGVHKGRLGGNVAGQYRNITVLVIAVGQFYNLVGGVFEELSTVHVGGYNGAVARQGQSQSLVEAVHGVGGKHARAGAAGGTGILFHGQHVGVADAVVGGHHHRVDQIQGIAGVLARSHGATRDKAHENIHALRGHEHAEGDFDAVADADHGVDLVGVDHVFYAVGDQIARGQGIQHAVVSHSDAVVDGDGVEFRSKAALLFNQFFNVLTDLVQVGVTGHKLGEGIDHRNQGAAHLFVLHSVGPP